MKIEEQKAGEVVVLTVEGPAVYGSGANRYYDRIVRFVHDGAAKVVVDLSNIK